MRFEIKKPFTKHPGAWSALLFQILIQVLIKSGSQLTKEKQSRHLFTDKTHRPVRDKINKVHF